MVIAFFPVFWLLSTSFKPYEEWASSPPHWLPAKPTLQNYRIVFAPEAARRFAAKQRVRSTIKYPEALGLPLAPRLWSRPWPHFSPCSPEHWPPTRFAVSALGAAHSLFSFCVLACFRRSLWWSRWWCFSRCFGSPIPILGLILAYTAFTLPFSIWMIRSFIEEIPADLEGVARVHGMGQFEAFIKVTLPLIRGGLWRRPSLFSSSIGRSSCSL